MESNELAEQVNKDLGMSLPVNLSAEAIKERLSAYINDLIQHNFEYLVTLLYRIDVSEARVKSLLQNNPGANAGDIIASLIIERQMQKVKARKLFSSNKDDVTDDEKW